MNYKIGLTGATGSLGSIITKKLKKLNFIKFKKDLRNRNEVFNWVKKNNLDIVIHLAAIVPIKEVNRNKRKALEVNYFGTKNIVDASIESRIKWFFFSSTSHVYKHSNKKISENSLKRPISYYGKTKLLAENYIIKSFKKKKIKFCIGRIFSTTNKNQKKNYLVPDLKYKIKNAKHSIKLENLNHHRDFISMNDITNIIQILLRKKYTGVLNFGSGEGTYLKDIAYIIGQKHKKTLIFNDNKTNTKLVANVNKLKKIYKSKITNNIKKMIF